MNPYSSRSPWTAEIDEAFFRLVQSLFTPAYLEAASGLLASYDEAFEPALICL